MAGHKVMITVRVEPLTKQELAGVATAIVDVDKNGTALDIARSLLATIQERGIDTGRQV